MRIRSGLRQISIGHFGLGHPLLVFCQVRKGLARATLPSWPQIGRFEGGMNCKRNESLLGVVTCDKVDCNYWGSAVDSSRFLLIRNVSSVAGVLHEESRWPLGIT